jgi:hypothetical protein
LWSVFGHCSLLSLLTPLKGRVDNPMSGERRDDRFWAAASEAQLGAQRKVLENYVQRLIDLDYTDNWLSAPTGTSDHIIILST